MKRVAILLSLLTLAASAPIVPALSPAPLAQAAQPLPPLPAETGEQPPPLPPPAPSTIVVEPPPSASAPPPEPPPPVPAYDPKKLRTSIKGEIGGQYARVHDVAIPGVKVNLMFGGQNDSLAHYGLLSFMVGSTEQSRRAWDLRVGYMGDLLRFGIVRAGVGAEAGYLVIRRVTYDDRAYAFGIGALFHVGFDVIPMGPHGEHALTLDARFDAHIHFGDALLFGPSLLAGYRW